MLATNLRIPVLTIALSWIAFIFIGMCLGFVLAVSHTQFDADTIVKNLLDKAQAHSSIYLKQQDMGHRYVFLIEKEIRPATAATDPRNHNATVTLNNALYQYTEIHIEQYYRGRYKDIQTAPIGRLVHRGHIDDEDMLENME